MRNIVFALYRIFPRKYTEFLALFGTRLWETMKGVKTKQRLMGVRGFSLVELLVVIAVIAIIAAIAIPNIANITSQATYAKDQRNAQNVASVASAARASGYTTAWVSETGAITALTATNGQGISYVGANGQTQTFGVSGMNATSDSTGAAHFLRYVAGSPDSVLYSQTSN